MGLFRKYCHLHNAIFHSIQLCHTLSILLYHFPVSFTKLHEGTIEWEWKRFFAYMAASAYHVILTEVENHIFKHIYVYKQSTLTKEWNFKIFVQILYGCFRYTGRLFLRCAIFVPSKHSSWWRRFENVLKTSFVFVFRRHLQDVFKTSWSRRICSP